MVRVGLEYLERLYKEGMYFLGCHDSGGDTTAAESDGGKGRQSSDNVRAAALTLMPEETLQHQRAAAVRVAAVATA